YLETFGCQMNVLDSELVLNQLRARGYESTEHREAADVVLYNTCSVREHAEQKVWSRLGEMRDWKKSRPHLVIGVIGCMAERDGTNIFQRFPHVDLLCGPGELDKLAVMVDNLTAAERQSAEFGAQDSEESCGTRAGAGQDDASSTGLSAASSSPAGRQVALMGANTRRSSTLAAAEDNLELLDLSRSFSPDE